jgi:hypothetical protein
LPGSDRAQPPPAARSPRLAIKTIGTPLPNHTTFVPREHAGPALSPTQPVPELAVLVPTRSEPANLGSLANLRLGGGA